jgi:hypothetical protein
VIFTTSGVALSYGPDLPPGATIVVLAGAVYLLVLTGGWLRKRVWPARPRAHAAAGPASGVASSAKKD